MTPYRLDGLELAAGQALGRPGRVELAPTDATPREALAAALLPALQRTPCVVSFSGGRDSSAVLAVAAETARREGLPLPIPVTKRYPDAPASDETEWQEQVLAHVGVEDWVRLDLDAGEQHVLGPAATGLLRRHGLLWPSHLHLQLPVLEVARGGAVVTGVGGDEILGGVRRARTAAVLQRRTRPELRDALRVGYAAAPRFVKRLVQARALRDFGPWLRPHARRRARAALAEQAAAEPVLFPRRLAWWLGLPYLDVGLRNLAYVAAEHDVLSVNPLVEPGFVGSLAALPPEHRYATRTEAMRMLFGDLLPDALLSRRSKASFDLVDAAEPRLELLERWSGEGVDHTLVDANILRREWARPLTNPSTTALLQAAWLALEDRASAGYARELVGDAR